MFKPDLLVSWPRNNDYPLWRQYIRDNRSRFNEVIIVFTETNQGNDYREFVREAMFPDEALIVDITPLASGEDWRNHAVNSGLLHSYNAEWIWFTEQDFTPGWGFWKEVENYVNEGYSVIGILDGSRIHPASLFVKREALNKTNKDFGIIPDKADHFAKFTTDLVRTSGPIKIINSEFWKHFNGLSHNFTLLTLGQTPNWRKEEFDLYLKGCLQVGVPLDWDWVNLVENYLKKEN